MSVFSKERDRTVDAAKGLGLLLVFVGHAVEFAPGPEAKALFAAIYAFHMPLFFLLSGYVLVPALEDPRPFRETLAHVFRRLVVPYLAFGTLFLLTAFVRRFGWAGFANGEAYFAITHVLLKLLIGNPLPGVVIWFLYATAAVRLLLAVSALLLRAAGVPALALVTTAAWLYWGFKNPETPTYAPDLYLRPFAILGYTALTLVGAALRSQFDAFVRTPLRPSHRASLVLAAGFATFFLGRLNVPLPYVAVGSVLETNLFAPILAIGNFGNPLVLLATAIVGTAATLLFADVLLATRAGSFLAKAGERSLGVFCLNGFALAFLNQPAAAKIAEHFGADTVAPFVILMALLQWHAAVSLVGAWRKVTRRRARGSKQEPRPADSASHYSPPGIRASGPA